MNLLLFRNFVNFFCCHHYWLFSSLLIPKKKGKKIVMVLWRGDKTFWVQNIIWLNFDLVTARLFGQSACFQSKLTGFKPSEVKNGFFFTDSVGWGSLFQKLIFELQLQLTDNMFKKHKTQVTFGRYHADVGQCQLQTRQLTKPIWQPSRFEGFVKKSLVLRFLIIRTYPKKITASPKAHVNVM